MHNIKKYLYVLPLALLASCTTPKNISYFQDAENNSVLTLQSEHIFRLRPEDKVNIIVNSKDPSLSALFTLSSYSSGRTLGASVTPLTTAGSGGGSGYTVAYTVDSQGNIEFPVLGSIHAEGMTRYELAKYIQNQLVSQKLVLDAIVTVEYVNMSISVLGEVHSPGRQYITNDHYTVLDAISTAGDLSIDGRRADVKVLRSVNGQMQCYTFDLCSTQKVISSPAYYLQQNDIVYVTPNDKRKRESTVNGNSMQTPGFWISLASFAMTTGLLIYNLTK